MYLYESRSEQNTKLFGGKENITRGLKLFPKLLVCTREAGLAHCTSSNLRFPFFWRKTFKKRRRKEHQWMHVQCANSVTRLRERERERAAKQCGMRRHTLPASCCCVFFFRTSEILLWVFCSPLNDTAPRSLTARRALIPSISCASFKTNPASLLCISPTSQSPSRISSLSAASRSPSFHCASFPSDCHIICLFTFWEGEKTPSTKSRTLATACFTGPM